MGHHFGGATAFGAASKCDKVGQVISLDPWFFPAHQDIDSLKLKEHQRSLVIKAEHFKEDVSEATDDHYDQNDVLKKVSDACKIKPTEVDLLDWMKGKFDHDLTMPF